MQRIILLIILLTLSRKITSQTASEQPPKEHNLSIGIVASPDYCYRSLSSSSQYQWMVNYRTDLEVPKYNYCIGLSLEYKLAKHFAIETAVLYSDKGYKTKEYKYYIGLSPMLGLQAYIRQDKLHYKYIDVPLKANIYILTKRFQLYITAGATFNILSGVEDTYTLTYPNGQVESKYTVYPKSNYTNYGISVISGIGASYDIGQQCKIKLEPVYRRSLTSLTSGDVREILYSYGINAGVYYRF